MNIELPVTASDWPVFGVSTGVMSDGIKMLKYSRVLLKILTLQSVVNVYDTKLKVDNITWLMTKQAYIKLFLFLNIFRRSSVKIASISFRPSHTFWPNYTFLTNYTFWPSHTSL